MITIMKIKKRAIVFLRMLLLLAIISSSSCLSQIKSEGKNNHFSFATDSTKASLDLVETLMEELMKLPDTPPGMSVAVSSNDQIIFAEGYGYSNLSTKQRVTPKTQFRAASVSKIITVTALAKLMEEDKLNVNGFVHEYLPSYPKKTHPFTIKQLSGHLSGTPHYSNKDKVEVRHYHSVEDALDVFSHIPLLSKPGDTYRYSTHAYTLLSRVMEKASNKSFLNLLKEDVLKPLSMHSTGPHEINNPTKDMTALYNVHRDGINKRLHTKIIYPENPSYKWAGGGLISTPSDLVKMANSYMNGFIKTKVVDAIFETQRLNSGEATGVGIGWRQNWDIDNRRIYEHAGAMEGTRTVVSLFPDQELAISVMGNAMALWRIEETAHMLALPFLTVAAPLVQPKGMAKLSIMALNREGKQVKKNGTLILDGEHDRIIIDSDTENEQAYKLIYMQRGNTYALIHPHGILYTEISLNSDAVSGKTMYYASANVTKPSKGIPFFQFNGILKNEN